MLSYWLDRSPTNNPPAEAPTPLPRAPLDADVAVVGAGLTGLVTALLLARAGKRVVLLEARSVGAVTTGHTTGKVSLLQGTKLSRLLRHQPGSVVRSYVEANREGQAWLLRFCDRAGIRAERRTAVTYAATEEQRAAARAEHDAAQRLGMTTRWVDDLDLPFPTFGAVVLDEQAQIDPVVVLDELVREFEEHGGVLVEGARVTRVDRTGPPILHTDVDLEVRAGDVVLATGTPVVDRGLHFAKVEAHRSYVLMFTGADVPEEMLISAGSPTRSVREVIDQEGTSRLMVGGAGHVVGRTASARQHLVDLRTWTHRHFPAAEETHAWSAQDYRSHDGLPLVGSLPLGQGHVHVATGFDKWGLTNGVAAALQISADLLGSEMSWASPAPRHLPSSRSVREAARANLAVGAHLVGDWVAAEIHATDAAPTEGAGQVGRRGRDPRPVATSTVSGASCRVSAICTHLGGVLTWNDAEQSWDCPLHGSRFAPDGAVLEGPATRPLPSVSSPE